MDVFGAEFDILNRLFFVVNGVLVGCVEGYRWGGG